MNNKNENCSDKSCFVKKLGVQRVCACLSACQRARDEENRWLMHQLLNILSVYTSEQQRTCSWFPKPEFLVVFPANSGGFYSKLSLSMTRPFISRGVFEHWRNEVLLSLSENNWITSGVTLFFEISVKRRKITNLLVCLFAFSSSFEFINNDKWRYGFRSR